MAAREGCNFDKSIEFVDDAEPPKFSRLIQRNQVTEWK
jgi:hypothetical protein